MGASHYLIAFVIQQLTELGRLSLWEITAFICPGAWISTRSRGLLASLITETSESHLSDNQTVKFQV